MLPLVVRAGAGSVRDSLSVLDQLMAGAGRAGLTYDRAIALLGYTDDALLDEVVDAFAAGDGAAVFRGVDKVVEAGQDPRRFAEDLLDRLRDLIVLAAVPDAGGHRPDRRPGGPAGADARAGGAASAGAELARAAEIGQRGPDRDARRDRRPGCCSS